MLEPSTCSTIREGQTRDLTFPLMPKKKIMKAQFVEGPEATAKFEQLASAILQANPAKKQTTNAPSQKKPKKSDKS
jgi:hypothetical protein